MIAAGGNRLKCLVEANNIHALSLLQYAGPVTSEGLSSPMKWTPDAQRVQDLVSEVKPLVPPERPGSGV